MSPDGRWSSAGGIATRRRSVGDTATRCVRCCRTDRAARRRGGVAPFALGAPYLLARVQFPGRVLFDALVHLPLRLPAVLTGYELLVLFGRAGPIGRVLEATPGLTFAFRWTGAVIAAAVMAFPLFVRAIRLSLEAIPHDIDDMAASLGARPWATFFQVLLPLSLPGIARLAVVSIALAVGALLASEWLARRSAYRRRNLL